MGILLRLMVHGCQPTGNCPARCATENSGSVASVGSAASVSSPSSPASASAARALAAARESAGTGEADACCPVARCASAYAAMRLAKAWQSTAEMLPARAESASAVDKPAEPGGLDAHPASISALAAPVKTSRNTLAVM
ncbi:hypothetical protein D9M68_715700 [compost metagenome]